MEGPPDWAASPLVGGWLPGLVLQNFLQAFLDDHRSNAQEEPEWLDETGAPNLKKSMSDVAAIIASLLDSCWAEFISNTELASAHPPTSIRLLEFPVRLSH